MQVIIVLAACVAGGSALDLETISSYFGCPDVNVTEDFDIGAFSGTWYQQAYSLGSALTQGWSYCGVSNWTKINETTLYMVNKEKGLLGTWQSVEGYAVLEDASLGNFTTTFSTLFGTNSYQLKVLATDYNNYAITYSCSGALGIPLHAAWITTRVQDASGAEAEELEDLIQAAIDSVEGLYNSDFIRTKQEDCA